MMLDRLAAACLCLLILTGSAAATAQDASPVQPGYILTGHNDHALIGWTYVDNLEHAVQLLLSRSDAALVPSFRPVGLSQVIVGDRLHDRNWVAINVNRAHYLAAGLHGTAAKSQ